ncbi:PH domain-containing protein [Pedobacter montanisoli]|uniref:PH domain-containing protein n=1 Tax=Pedobacter montanisoli TaxID=2923277 RepID=A0ABS9ZW60_9SPHI|nr:PH domain-containing protein [Pedobacter montanisoli]MCJ0742539.1 PH domain-containing protein [Pedobacter montanisoli]
MSFPFVFHEILSCKKIILVAVFKRAYAPFHKMQDFTNQPIDLDSLPQYQETPLNKPSSKYWKVIVINIFIFLILIGLGISVLVMSDQDIKAYLYLILSGYIFLALILFIIFRISLNKRGFALRDKDVIYKDGVIAETTTIVPLSRIQHVELNEGIFSRMFGLGTIEIYTAAGSEGKISLAGIEIELAKNIKEALIKRLDYTQAEQ